MSWGHGLLDNSLVRASFNNVGDTKVIHSKRVQVEVQKNSRRANAKQAQKMHWLALLPVCQKMESYTKPQT